MKRGSEAVARDEGAKRRKTTFTTNIYDFLVTGMDKVKALFHRKRPDSLENAPPTTQMAIGATGRPKPEVIDLTGDDEPARKPLIPKSFVPQRTLPLHKRYPPKTSLPKTAAATATAEPLIRPKEKAAYISKLSKFLNPQPRLWSYKRPCRSHRAVAAKREEKNKEKEMWESIMSGMGVPTKPGFPTAVPTETPQQRSRHDYKHISRVVKPQGVVIDDDIEEKDLAKSSSESAHSNWHFTARSSLSNESRPTWNPSVDSGRTNGLSDTIEVIEIPDSPSPPSSEASKPEKPTKRFIHQKYDPSWLQRQREDVERSRSATNACSTQIRKQQETIAEEKNALDREIALKISKLEIESRLKKKKKTPKLPPLPADHASIVESAWNSNDDPDEVFATAYSISIKRRDLQTLNGASWLNDEVINFYLNLLATRSGVDESLPSVHVMSTFFYQKLSSAGYKGVQRWTRRVDIFAKDMVLVPIHLGMHWCLAVVDFARKSLVYYDSLRGENSACLNALAGYVCSESVNKKGVEFSLDDWTICCAADVPEQQNGSDCGVFACQYAEFLLRRCSFTFSQQDMPYFRKKMVYEIVTKKLLN